MPCDEGVLGSNPAGLVSIQFLSQFRFLCRVPSNQVLQGGTTTLSIKDAQLGNLVRTKFNVNKAFRDT